MVLNRCLNACALAIVLQLVLAVAALENSVLLQIDQVESIENLPRHKYSTRQFDEIAAMLNRKEEKIRVATYNILFNLYDHNREPIHRWPQRLPRLAALIQEIQPDLLCVQELYPDQLEELNPYLNETYAFYCKPCVEGELNGIFYRKDRFEVVDAQVWYLSSTSKQSSSETLTMVKLKDMKTGKSLAAFNAHLSFSKVDKRDFQARFIAEKIQEVASDIPTLFCGDLNTFPNWFDVKTLPFYDGDYIHRILTQGALKEAREQSLLGHLGPISTFTNNPGDIEPFQGTGTPGVFLDHIYVTRGVNVLIHAVEPAKVEGHYPSDHMPIIVDIVLEQ